MAKIIDKTWLIKAFSQMPAPIVETIMPANRLISASVLIPIIDDIKEGLSILFTQRTEHLKHHAGQISFPGGRMELIDHTPIDTALRETMEEIGLTQQKVTLLGSLPAFTSFSGFWVTPIVGLVQPPLELVLDPFEVASVFTAPLNIVLNIPNFQQQIIEMRGKQRVSYSLEYKGHRIWGMTAAILIELAKRLEHAAN
jgi:8-oxo-dGTP pyrophosphatase MutT (NUDIX family)